MIINELFPAWPALEKRLENLKFSPKEKISIHCNSGIPYLSVRCALLGFSVFVITSEEKAEPFALDAKTFSNFLPQRLGWTIGAFQGGSLKEQAFLLEEALEKKGILWFGTAKTLQEKVPLKQEFINNTLELKAGKVLPYLTLLNFLSKSGYKRTSFVEEKGEFALRGETFDFWSPQEDQAVRLIYAHDTIESMHTFDPFSQRTVFFLAKTKVLPLVISDSLNLVSPKSFSENKKEEDKIFLADYFPKKTILLLDKTGLTNDFEFFLESFPLLEVGSSGEDIQVFPSSKISLKWDFFKKELADYSLKGFKNFVFCEKVGESERLEDLFDQQQFKTEIRPQILIAPLHQGFINHPLKLNVWSFGDLIGEKRVFRKISSFKIGRALDSISEIRIGDYVVHERFGIGRYKGLERVKVRLKKEDLSPFPKEMVSEFLALEYRGGDRLLAPVTDFKCVQKYVGQEGKKPQLYSLDGAAWEKLKQNVKKEVKEIAQGLLKTAALRQISHRTKGSEDLKFGTIEPLQKEFADAFPYEETEDQLAAIEDIRKDLDSHSVMDRLVCGDVGYGKTEVAMRAAFKVVADGRQVTVLVPTTILAEQHFKNFSERFALFPVKIGMISRFQKKAEQKKILEDLKKGVVDILIGTHRLLQKDVAFKNLGLMILDEEHRFGVKQKEKLKEFKSELDVLALSATPIPRTLSLSLGGVRNISVIESPPMGRLPIETRVGIFDEKVLREAVEREIGRGGQIFYVHNRVATIEARKKLLEHLFPNLKIGLAHGQMSAELLEKAMWNFLHKKWDILLSTSIIESGLDIPSVNTLIVEDSEEFGLSQLYQLRGRVGRTMEKAYCILFFSDWATLSQDARKRLEAIQEFSALGSGIKLALRDMEIRGTGNILGAQQHGWINAVGFELYCQLLSQAVEEIKFEREIINLSELKAGKKEKIAPEIELNLSAFIPEESFEAEGERIALYKKMFSLQSEEELSKMKEELSDLLGQIPEPLKNLLSILHLRLSAEKLSLVALSEREDGVVFSWNVKKGSCPIDFVRLAKDFPLLIVILPIRSTGNQEGRIEILFKFENESQVPLIEIEKFLKIAKEYVIIKNLS
ncbi:MAG: transcription-repair coupling factor [Elusimicrobia bacterium RIFCSPLOWO2_02_FULL_39_32]|nr:MAG: transcription-repair coupling factor [Elusimicrobia bacterium GWA2_38_7]OGR80418.1 MAG: transcription-repair coupling factor [Elusimicrobia bacterium RIFCSPHIGHO2_02_FULL_39_36]OGR93300.1 MAG: transcription-repair coupling factor [Elusimicrobia bacterium RIFCSPLOWO2_02_FULL_39_32]OGS00530.1 MAG: transcription-repair coupling factor [Elusimicrobia bacterium RIFCSPLOWO2_12_FULL_39_28]